MPMAVFTFLESYDFSGKTVCPLIAHGGSGQSGTRQVLESVLPDCTVLQGLAIPGKTAQESESQTRELLTDWLAGLNLLK